MRETNWDWTKTGRKLTTLQKYMNMIFMRTLMFVLVSDFRFCLELERLCRAAKPEAVVLLEVRWANGWMEMFYDYCGPENPQFNNKTNKKKEYLDKTTKIFCDKLKLTLEIASSVKMWSFQNKNLLMIIKCCSVRLKVMMVCQWSITGLVRSDTLSGGKHCLRRQVVWKNVPASRGNWFVEIEVLFLFHFSSETWKTVDSFHAGNCSRWYVWIKLCCVSRCCVKWYSCFTVLQMCLSVSRCCVRWCTPVCVCWLLGSAVWSVPLVSFRVLSVCTTPPPVRLGGSRYNPSQTGENPTHIQTHTDT